mmetsp:Transcript_21684/g.66832  ORF Transcript_21684/g.66832 Transcript_21684/m.66832 type:complete len:529 (-) Transcript_21684:206-1792(-)|eukprot:CAMPEP_0198664508 /NCGR_PEP_ID=MMETSP1467-20131203/56520_1 /TAXON_ID=1462469 /ORGANISM="unid. sp., Strain CCMP2135" /LENGTH=528 /DNA_ID=CAMNT_0044401075 /DNA_START=214 /DNA_END=1800 /DNA_ORIENTATION=-
MLFVESSFASSPGAMLRTNKSVDRVPRPQRIPKKRREMSLQRTSSREFEPVRLLGRGAFGAVLLVRKKSTGKTYALKVMRKRSLVDRNAINVARVEREVSAVVRHPYLVQLCYAFQSKTRLYLVTEYFEGGSLDVRLETRGCLEDADARRAAGQLTLAIEYLHSVGVIHRDIKAANVLLESNGDARLSDFGLAAYCEDAARHVSFCGTLAYVAPELFLKRDKKNTSPGYTTAVDWWSLGVLMFEMLRGHTPFEVCNPGGDESRGATRKLFENILHKDADFNDDPRGAFTDASRDCISSLLRRDPLRRAGAAELRKHPYLAAAVRTLDVSSPLLDRGRSRLRAHRAASEPLVVRDRRLDDDDDARRQQQQPDDDGGAPNFVTPEKMELARASTLDNVVASSSDGNDDPTPPSSAASSSSAGMEDDELDDDALCESARLYLSETDDPTAIDSIDLLPASKYRPDAFKGFSYCQDEPKTPERRPKALPERRKTSPGAFLKSNVRKVANGLTFIRGAAKRARETSPQHKSAA